MLIPASARAARDGGVLPLTSPGLRRDLVFVSDAVEAVLTALEIGLTPGEMLNVGSGIQTSNEETVSLIGRIMGKDIRVAPGAYAPHETDNPCWVADTSRCVERLGWRARTNLEEGLRLTVAWVLDHDAGR